ncbi:MAG: alpha/beta hydrolase [Pseudomonadota bacterium]
MAEPQFLTTPEGRHIAYHRTQNAGASGPGVVFLGGFKSDMEGTKALHLEAWCAAQGRDFLRFDYSGHGRSSGDFLAGSIGEWTADARAAIGQLTHGRQVLVGSSMGGWIALLVARAMGDRIAGLLGIAAAPDFTEDSMWEGFTDAQRKALEQEGQVALPSDYSDDPYIITRRLIEDGRTNLVLRDPLPLPFPVRLLHGTADADVAQSVPLALLSHGKSPDMALTLVKDADHRFSEPENLALVEATLTDLLNRV